MTASCHFYVLNRDDPEGSEALRHNHRNPAGELLLDHPPAVGDLIWLGTECWRVVTRAWSPAAYGSQSWPALNESQSTPIWLDLMVEPAAGLFVGPASDVGTDQRVG